MLDLQLPERLETERLLIQRLRYEDAEEIFDAYASKPQATKFVAWPTHLSAQETRRFLDYAIKAWDEHSEYSFGIRLKATNILVGSFGAINDHGKVSFGYIFNPDDWSKGYATEVCRRMLKELSTNKKIHRIWTLVDVDNIASIKVLLKCGMVEEARLHQWVRFINQDNVAKDCFIYWLPR